ncbi:ABC transporter permease [Lactonifactor longoviformis]|uniref:NitT/TauT family transport system permease protein n=1 Tax=Lactonifactor longoviformis DSM 17459 TaxID=1122155 RepID=A0A1M4YQU0_9CLOT|nr:ABC transporter permease [Lactonifactor longoviformis]POP32795.1 ABC transporter permease [Lactonifactor longoviformis]SHF08165.1 NitT/TauT family transport system permease protein [Lactonifactor longoviformis DSM 17459]
MIKVKIRKPISRKKYLLLAAAAFLTVFLVWSAVSSAGMVKEIFLPRPSSVLRYYLTAVSDGTLWENTKISIIRISLGFLMAVVLGIPVGILVGTFAKTEAAVRPLCEFIRYMPVPAFVPLIMVWIGIGESAKVAVIFIGTFFQLVLMVADDALSVPGDLINAGYTLGADTKQAVFRILIPAMMPRLMETLRMMIGWAWTYLVSAELVAADTGLGYTILKSQRFLKTDAIFGGILLIGLLGLVTDRIFALLNKKLFPWAKGGRQV